MRINHNISAMNANRLLNINNSSSAKALEKLSSGKRINRAGDDAAGMAISEKMRAQVNGLKIASRNSLDGVSLVQTAEGAMNEVHSMLQRMRELAVQSANGTMTDADRSAVQDEVNQLTSEINRITNGTEYNTRHILRGNEEPKSNTIVEKMSTGEPANVLTDNLHISSENEILKKDFSNKTLSVEINGKKTEVNLQGFSGTTNTTLTAKEFLTRINDALGDEAVATFNGNFEIEIKTLKPGGNQNIKIEGSAVPDLFNGKTQISVYGLAENSAGTSKGSFYFNDIPESGSFIIVGNERIDFFDSSKEPYVGSNKAIDISGYKYDYTNADNTVFEAKKTQNYVAAIPGTPNVVSPGELKIDNLENLKNGDTIQIGSTTLKFVSPGPASATNGEVQIGADLKTTIDNLNLVINNNILTPTTGQFDFKAQISETKTEINFNDVTTIEAGNIGSIDGKIITIKDTKGNTTTFEFDTNGILQNSNNIGIDIMGAKTSDELAKSLELALNPNALGESIAIPGLSVSRDKDKLVIKSNDGNNFELGGADLNKVLSTTVPSGGIIKSSTIIKIEDENGINNEFNLSASITGATVTVNKKINEVITPATPGTPEQPGLFTFELKQNLKQGDKIDIDGVELTAGTDFKIGNDKNATTNNLLSAIKANTILSGRYDGINVSGSTITFSTKSSNTLSAQVKILNAPHVGIKTTEELVKEIKSNIQLNNVDFDVNNNNPKELIVKAKDPGFKGNLITLEGTLKEFNTNLQVGANSGQGFRLEIGDIRAKSLRISSDKPTGNPGVTGAAYVKMPNVTDGISSNAVEYAIDVSSEKTASAAIEVFNNAIIKVASERSKLGATQNRLEHTIANLDNTDENLTAAMSRIEDTDMALEMANFQKLNVLQQAGTSMLAQANQQPQSILKLLQG